MATLDPFRDALTIPSVLTPNHVGSDGTRYYKITMRNGARRVHSDLPADTPFWGYEGQFPGPTIETQRDKKSVVEFANELAGQLPYEIMPEHHGGHHPQGHIFLPDKPWTVVHLHGSPTTPTSDGWSDDAYFPGQSVTFHYPEQKQAALLWYHDHANMITRLNVYSGLAGLFVVRSEEETKLGLPVAPPYEIPLLIQDRNLEERAGKFTGRFSYQKLSIHDGFSGQYVLVNGTIWPYHEVEPRQYRLRIVNGAQYRTYNLKLVLPDGTPSTKEMLQIGVDCGFLPTAVRISDVNNDPGLVLAPAERADVLVDFTAFAGKEVALAHSTEFSTLNVMQFKVGNTGSVPPLELTELPAMEREKSDPKTPVRRIGLYTKQFGGQLMHTINGLLFHDAIEEKPELDSVEIWEFFNATVEPHPMHVHQVHFEVLDRRPILNSDDEHLENFDTYFRLWLTQDPTTHPLPEGWNWDGASIPADRNEVWPKDTVRAPGFHVTRIRVRFGPYTGKYMYHCHFLDHEDMEMMRPFVVVPKGFPKMNHDH